MAETARACTGDYYRMDPDKPIFRRSASDHLPALPAAGDDGSAWSEARADDAYALAVAMLENSITFTEPAISVSSHLDCPPDIVSGVRLIRFLAGDGVTSWLGATNVHHWLGEAYRAGAGAPADPARARRHFPIARVSGHDHLGPSAWGERPDDTLARLYARPADRAVFEETAAATRYPGAAQLVIADIVAASDPKRARALRRLAPHRVDGKPVFAWVNLPPITWDMDGDWTRTGSVG